MTTPHSLNSLWQFIPNTQRRSIELMGVSRRQVGVLQRYTHTHTIVTLDTLHYRGKIIVKTYSQLTNLDGLDFVNSNSLENSFIKRFFKPTGGFFNQWNHRINYIFGNVNSYSFLKIRVNCFSWTRTKTKILNQNAELTFISRTNSNWYVCVVCPDESRVKHGWNQYHKMAVILKPKM